MKNLMLSALMAISGCITAFAFVIEGDRPGTVVTPEPGTWLMVASAAVIAFVVRKKMRRS